MKKYLVLLLVSIVSLSSYGAKFDDLKWLPGSWRGTTSAGVFDCLFTETVGNLILGVAKLTTADSKEVLFYEYTQISQTDKGLTLSPMPFGKPGGYFLATEISSRKVVFENPAYEFPKKITYELNSQGFLALTVEGIQNEKPFKNQWLLQRR